MTEALLWEDDALTVTGPSGHAVTLRYAFGNVRAHDRAEPVELLLLPASFGLMPAVGFLRHFAETDDGAPLYATEAAAYEGLKALGYVAVRDAFLKVFARLTEDMGFTVEAEPAPSGDTAGGGGAEPGKPEAPGVE